MSSKECSGSVPSRRCELNDDDDDLGLGSLCFTQEAIVVLRRVFAEVMGDEWARPQIPEALQAAHQQLQQDFLQAGGPQAIPEWIVGNPKGSGIEKK